MTNKKYDQNPQYKYKTKPLRTKTNKKLQKISEHPPQSPKRRKPKKLNCKLLELKTEEEGLTKYPNS